MNIDYKYKPYSFKRVRFWFSGAYKIFFEDTHIMTVFDFEEAKTIVGALNGAFLLGQTHYALYRQPFDGPEFHDGHDHEGFKGGCIRHGHSPDECPEVKHEA